MCGIAGIITQAPLTPADIAGVRTTNEKLTHRGPDGSGEFQDANVMLAMRRLSIIDLDGGWQPLYNEDRTLALVANGEIYNFVELRERLEKLGHHFQTHSDCETILHLYEEHGLDFVHQLEGDFAIGLDGAGDGFGFARQGIGLSAGDRSAAQLFQDCERR